jgi:peptidyl-prolyl cis-trans isomerase C
MEKSGTIILDIVGISMSDTIGRELAKPAPEIGRGRRHSLLEGRRWRRGYPWLAAVLLSTLLLSACSNGRSSRRPTAASSQPVVVVSTVESTVEPATALPTAPPPTVTPTVTPPAPLAAMVNGQYIFLADYERRVAQFEQALFEQGLDPASEDGQDNLVQIRQQVLDSLIDYALIEQGGEALGVSLGDDELESRVEADIAAGGGQAAFEEWLQATGQTRDDYKAMLRESMLTQRVMEVVTADVPDTMEQVHARHIVVDSEEEAQEIVDMLQQGADFVSLARERSVDLATKDNGGDLGWFPRGMVAPELEAAVFGLQPGEISGVVPLGEGYHIIQVVERDPARALSPEAMVDLRFAIFDRWLAEQRAVAVIERFVGD